jgi:plasmid stabilization system protein ParE
VSVLLPILFTEKANRDLDEITHYIADQGYPETALSYTDRIYAFCKTLSDFPLKHKACQKNGF